MMNQMNQSMNPQGQQAPAGMPAAPAAGAENGTIPKFCPNCGQATNGAKFCGNCGQKLI
jgi:membrane protease subunit (stomatin/prohibitin family)